VGKLIRDKEQIKRNRRVTIKAKWDTLLILIKQIPMSLKTNANIIK